MRAEGASAKALNILVMGDESGTSSADMLEFLRVFAIVCHQQYVNAYVYSAGGIDKYIAFVDRDGGMYYAGAMDLKVWKDEWA